MFLGSNDWLKLSRTIFFGLNRTTILIVFEAQQIQPKIGFINQVPILLTTAIANLKSHRIIFDLFKITC